MKKKENIRRALILALAEALLVLAAAAAGRALMIREFRREELRVIGQAAKAEDKGGMVSAKDLAEAFLTEGSSDAYEKGKAVLSAAGYGALGYRSLGTDISFDGYVWICAGAAAGIFFCGFFCFMRVSRSTERFCGESAEKKLQEERRAKERAEEERREVICYLENIAHQIRTPLTGITLAVECVKDETEDPEHREMMRESLENLDRIRDLTAVLLQEARLDAGRTVMNLTRNPMEDLFGRMRAEVNPLAKSHEVELTWQYDPEEEMVCDLFWLAEAVKNLIKNAITQTGAGGHVLVCAGENQILVQDDGPGFSGKEEQLYQRFYTGNVPSPDGGYGIGLHLARQIAVRQGGNLRLVSGPGEGARFLLRLPEGMGKNKKKSV